MTYTSTSTSTSTSAEHRTELLAIRQQLTA
jgi:hypothetical protein